MGYVGATPAAKALTSADITDGIIVDADINSSAAIALSKTALSAGTGITLATNTLNVDASQGHVTTVGALNAGSITSGFTSIDVGAGAITTTGALSIASMGTNWTNVGRTVADMGIATTIDINGGTIDGTSIGANATSTIKGTTIDATTDFTIGGTVITDNTITDDGTLIIASSTATSFSDGNITNVGNIALDSISADATDISIAVTDNSATALTVLQGSDAYLIIDTADSSESVSIGTGISGTVITIGHGTSETTFGDNVTITGDLTINGATVTNATTNLTVADPLVKYGQAYVGSAYDQGFIVTRGNGSASNTQNMGFIWDESADEFATIKAATEDGTTAGNVTVTDYVNLHVGAITADDTAVFSGSIELGHASDTTIARSGAGAITVEGTAVLLAGAQTGITTILNAGAKLGRDSQNLIDFATTDNKIILRVNNVDEVELVADAFQPTTNNGVALGTTALGWSDLHIATGGVINWVNGEMTITETNANLLTVAGGNLAGTFVGDITGDVTGNVSGTAATVTGAAQTNITSLGTLTALTVDDVAINGKVMTMTGSTDDTAVFTVGTNGTLSIVTTDTAAAAANLQITADGTVDIDSAGVLTLDSGAAINIEPAVGSAILLDGTISIDAGVVTGATSITSTAFVGDITGDVTGNADTVTTNANLTGDVTSTGNATAIAAGVIIDNDVKSDAAIAVSKTALSAGTGLTLSTNSLAVDASQTQITSVGDLGTGTIAAGFGVIDNGTSGIRTNTFTAETSIVPDAASGATLGTADLEWGHLYIGDDQKIYLGDGQDVSLEYDEDGTDQLRIAGNTVFANQVESTLDIMIDSTPADETVSGVTATFTAGEALVRGEVVYFKASDSKMWKAVATAAATSRCVAMAAADISADAAGLFLLQGFLADNGSFPAYTIGGALYTPEAETSSQNVPEQTAPDTDGDFVQVLGWAMTANSVYFNPSNDIIEHA